MLLLVRLAASALIITSRRTSHADSLNSELQAMADTVSSCFPKTLHVPVWKSHLARQVQCPSCSI